MSDKCPKCLADTRIEGNKMCCINLTCGWRRDIVVKVPPQAELWQEVNRLRFVEQRYTKLIAMTTELLNHLEDLENFVNSG